MQQKPKIYYSGQPGIGYGWGVCNANLSKALRQYADLDCRPEDADIVFVPLADHDFNPISDARGKRNFAYTFFEYPLGPNAAENAAKYDIVFCGSTWCLERMQERGIKNGKVLIQGVDHEIFRPQPRDMTREVHHPLRIFSGGKFEYRKGQDIVIAAFKKILEHTPDAELWCNWFNPWPSLVWSMFDSPHIGKIVRDAHGYLFRSQEEFFLHICGMAGIPLKNVRTIPSCIQEDLVKFMWKTDVGLFPNRCEGGTNLVMMEYMSCGKPVVASFATGHLDIAFSPADRIIYGATNEMKWVEIAPEMISMMFQSNAKWPETASQRLSKYTWDQTAKDIMGFV